MQEAIKKPEVSKIPLEDLLEFFLKWEREEAKRSFKDFFIPFNLT